MHQCTSLRSIQGYNSTGWQEINLQLFSNFSIIINSVRCVNKRNGAQCSDPQVVKQASGRQGCNSYLFGRLTNADILIS